MMHQLQPEEFEFAGEAEIGEAEAEASLYEAWQEAGVQEVPMYEAWQEASLGEAPMPEMQEVPMHEAEEMELAAEFLEVTNEAELDRFLGRLIRRVGRGLGRAVRSPLGRALGGALRPLARAALPIAGRALGTFVGGPLGGVVGGRLASAAGRLFGLELEGMSAEDREYEVGRRFVRFASRAIGNALRTAPTLNPQTVARQSVVEAARLLAPGLARGAALPSAAAAGVAAAVEPMPAGASRRGIWIRRGRRIVLFGV